MGGVSFEVKSQIGHLQLARPEVRNAFNDDVIEEITRVAENIPDGVRVLVLSGEGKAFSTGADLEWMRSMASYSHEENLADSAKLSRMFSALDNAPVPVLGRIHGAAIAGATGLVACCDYAIAGESTKFSFAEVRLGLVPAVISPYVVRKVGYSFARAMFMSAEMFDAETALRVGLIHRVVPDEELDAAVDATVASFLSAGPEALGESRALINKVWGKQPSDVSELTVETIARRRVSDEGQEGIAAFLEKRDPSWRTERS